MLEIPFSVFENFNFYPNPSIDKIQFSTQLVLTEIEIITINGTSVFKKELTENQHEISFNLSTGIYFIVFKTEGHQLVRKLVVQ